MTLLSPKTQDKNRSNKADYSILSPIASSFDMVGSPTSLMSLSSADYTAGGTLDPHVSKRIQRVSSLALSNQYFTEDGDTNNISRKNLVGKLSKMQQFFDNYNEAITNLEIEVADKQQEIDKLDALLRIKSETEESLKEQIWNLELKNQDLQQQINQFNFTSAKTLSEQTRLERENEILGQELENLKLMQQANEAKIKQIQQDHDQETHKLKRILHNLEKEEAELTKQLETVIAAKSSGQALFQSNNLNQVNPKLIEGQFTTKHAKDTKSDLEATTLRASLENAHIMIRTLQKQIQDDAVERREVDQLLREAQETIESYRSSAHGNFLKSPTSPTDSHYNFSRHNHQTQSKPPLGQSLGDELYHFFNSDTFERHVENTSNNLRTALFKDNPKKSSDIKREWDSSPDSNSISSEIVTLTLDARPSTKTISEKSAPAPLPLEQSEEDENDEKEEYGSLIKEPESYMYTPALKDTTDTKREEKNESSGHPTPEIEPHFKRNHSLTRAKNANGYLHIQQQQQQQQQPQQYRLQHRQNSNSSDKSHLTAIAITMMGNWMWKYKRRVIGNTISNNKHRRFVWIHPCSRTLYWSVIEPGSQGAEYRTKSALIESYVVLDSNQDRSVIPSILIKTSVRGIQVQCFDIKSHSIWCMSLRLLLMEGGTRIDKATSQWLDDIIKPVLGKRGLNTRVKRLLYNSRSEDQVNTPKSSATS